MLPIAEPFFLFDESMSRNAAPEVSASTGYPIPTVWDEWPGRDMSVNPLGDEEIIPHLGIKAGHRAVWITQDWRAYFKHQNRLIVHHISVLWLRGPGGWPFSRLEQPPVLIAVLATARRLVVVSDVPVHLRAKYDPIGSSLPMLERLQGRAF